ncbi:hypothetical protein [Simiduia agarivorans]|uniref:Uncharacterized protein n=1 Tax=Simiduia agarivorans (strain DSM 21679 / JCM 13881 / BCRC 17597 / SA1) TaxID=1117647 RepID=K4KNJ8_SIMAS|nr:hypothetical protein [Simiduia agarivorans]AFV00735.1 hypothetical protein M5M_18030 [Simiduia agarivorans SA1 = DSM 21679]
MRVIKIGFLLMVALLSTLSHADPVLSRSNMESYFAAMQAIKPLETRYADAFAEMEAQTESMSLADGGKQLADILRSQSFAGEVEQVLKANGFNSIEAFSAYSVKLLSGLMVQSFAESKPEMEQAMAQFDAQVQQMKQAGASPDMIRQMESGMAEAKRMLKEYQYAEHNLSAADKAAVAQNFEWLQAEFMKLNP